MTTISNTISTQTTTFLPKCPSVLQRKEIRSTFFKKMERAFSKKVVSINKTNKINSKQADQIDRLAAKEISQAEKEQATANKIDRLAAEEISQAEKEQTKSDNEADKIIRLAVKEITKAEREAKKDLAVRAAWEELTQRLAIDAPGAVFSQRIIVVE